jgi:hypothetical protein
MAAAPWPGITLWISKDGYDATSYKVLELPRDQTPNITLTPAAGDVLFEVHGTDACADLPPLYPTIPGGNHYVGEFVAYHSGSLVVHSVLNPGDIGGVTLSVSQVPPPRRGPIFGDTFTILASSSTIPNPYNCCGRILAPSFPIAAGYRYVLTFDADVILCVPYAVSLTRPR